MVKHMRTTRHAQNGKSHRSHLSPKDFKKFKNVMSEATRHAKSSAQKIFYDSIDNFKEKSDDMQDSLATYTRKKPFKSLGIAMVTGLVVGLLMRRK